MEFGTVQKYTSVANLHSDNYKYCIVDSSILTQLFIHFRQVCNPEGQVIFPRGTHHTCEYSYKGSNPLVRTVTLGSDVIQFSDFRCSPYCFVKWSLFFIIGVQLTRISLVHTKVRLISVQ